MLATGLSALYSSLPRKIEVPGDDWHCLRREDWVGVPALALFMSSLEFCNAVIQVRLRFPGGLALGYRGRWGGRWYSPEVLFCPLGCRVPACTVPCYFLPDSDPLHNPPPSFLYPYRLLTLWCRNSWLIISIMGSWYLSWAPPCTR